MEKNINVPVVMLENTVVYSSTVTEIEVLGKSANWILEKSKDDKLIFVVAQKKSTKTAPKVDDLYTYGTLCKIVEEKETDNKSILLLLECLELAEIKKYTSVKPIFVADIKIHEYINDLEGKKLQASINAIKRMFLRYYRAKDRMSIELLRRIESVDDINKMVNTVAHISRLNLQSKQQILEETLASKRVELLLDAMAEDIELMNIEDEILEKSKHQVEKQQKDYMIRERIKTLQEELGENGTSDIDVYRKKMEEVNPPKYVVDKIESELTRLQRIPVSSQENSIVRDYIERVLALPWNSDNNKEENKDLKKAIKILDEEHYGLEDVKKRVIETLAVEIMNEDYDANIICLVGSPGVGKTSIGKSIAHAMDREYVRISLGGVSDEADIRGHRRTYLGSVPGRIMNAMQQAKCTNPLILFDEIDKLTRVKGDPASALLEVLDSEQNKHFRDHYIELEYDLSDVMFVCTANSVAEIPAPLIDRMEIINISMYTDDEKYNIAKKYLYEKQLKNSGLTKSQLKIKKEAYYDMIRYYTREAGVRSLERCISKICAKAVTSILLEEYESVTISSSNIEEFLGKKRDRKKVKDISNLVGRVNGLAFTQVGGVVLGIESSAVDGVGKLEITGNIGKVMQESVKAGITYIRANSKRLGIDEEFYKNKDIHVHVPEGATPKDGPSAGITMCLAIISSLLNRKVNKKICMTGEITLNGYVLPIGGVQEKVLAGKDYGCTTVLLPKNNQVDVMKINEKNEDILKGIEIIYVETMDEVLKYALMEN